MLTIKNIPEELSYISTMTAILKYESEFDTLEMHRREHLTLNN